ncbi:MAG TPA: hypothetical protein VFB04_16700 [Terriglobales bacterium]|nr:hypothetical protein [Terriglobales bacterium]
MPLGLKRRQGGHDLHFLTFSCDHRQALVVSARRRDLSVNVLEQRLADSLV